MTLPPLCPCCGCPTCEEPAARAVAALVVRLQHGISLADALSAIDALALVALESAIRSALGELRAPPPEDA